MSDYYRKTSPRVRMRRNLKKIRLALFPMNAMCPGCGYISRVTRRRNICPGCWDDGGTTMVKFTVSDKEIRRNMRAK
jgi:hypothetical protein